MRTIRRGLAIALLACSLGAIAGEARFTRIDYSGDDGGPAPATSQYRNPVLGTDGIGSDMLEEACFAFFKHHDAGGTRWMDAYLEMLQNGNRLLERYFPGKRFGRVEAGYEADLTFWDYDPPTPLESGNVAGHVAFGMASRMVSGTMVAGRFIVKDRKPVFDAAAIAQRGRDETRRLWQRMEERK